MVAGSRRFGAQPKSWGTVCERLGWDFTIGIPLWRVYTPGLSDGGVLIPVAGVRVRLAEKQEHSFNNRCK